MTAVKEHGYYSGLNMALAGLIKGKGLTVLDIGCGDGMLVEWLRKNGQIARAYGIEARPEAAARARSRCDVVWNADVEAMPIDLPPSSLDLVILADVIEHLRSPSLVLGRIRELLKPSGMVAVSLPNVANYRVTGNLLFRNEWKYEPSGIMDDTHLRWFTRRSARSAFTAAGFEIRKFQYVFGGRWSRWLNRALFGLACDLLGAQMVFLAARTDRLRVEG